MIIDYTIKLFFLSFLPDFGILDCVNPPVVTYLRKSVLCPTYDVIEYKATTQHECAFHFQDSFKSSSRGFCFEEASSTCKIYSVPNLGGSSKTLNWISVIRKTGYLDFNSSYDLCKEKGLALALPQSREENDGMDLLSKGYPFYIDLFLDKSSLSFYTYLEGKSTEYFFWNTSQPDYRKNENCVRGSFWSKGEWDDYFCNLDLAVICQWPKAPDCIRGEYFSVSEEELKSKKCFKIQG